MTIFLPPIGLFSGKWWKMSIHHHTSCGFVWNRVYSQWNSHLIGIMIINHWVKRGTLFSDTTMYRPYHWWRSERDRSPPWAFGGASGRKRASIFSVISRSGFLGVSARQQIPSIPNQSTGLGQHVAQKKETRGQIRSNFCSPNDWRTRRFATACRSNNWRILRKHSQTSFKSSWKLYQAASAEGAEGPEGLGFSCSALKCQSCCSSLSNSSFIMRYRMECSPAAEDLCGT